jgi:Fe-S-cluster containining protein
VANKEPWRSIAAGAVVAPCADDALTWSEALASPCNSCGTSPCCTFLPVHRFRPQSLADLDYARYLVNFDRIELGLSATGEWHVYYRYPCRFLDRATFRCNIHGTPRQPAVCVNFNPYRCWYRKSLRGVGSDNYVRIDHPRLAWILDRVELDGERDLRALPAWDAMVAAFAELPYDEQRADDGEIERDPVHDAWKASVVEHRPLGDGSARVALRTFDELVDPCDDCGAWCCTALSFPHDVPTTYANLDYLRFLLGFPGLEIGVGTGGWTVVVRSRCRHLVGTRCGVYGTPERPLVCRYYDAHQCAYRVQFGQPRPDGFVRVRYADFDALAGAFAFDAGGQVVRSPSVDDVRAAIEGAWRERSAASAVHPDADAT